MSLESKSLTQLRSLAQSLGVLSDWSDDKAHLLQKIRLHADKQIMPEDKTIQVNIPPQTMNQALTRENIASALEGFKVLGLRASFPDEHTWELECNKKRDSGSMYMNMWSIIQCAREVVKP